MKKVLSVVLAFAMVLAVASFAMAATVSYTGSVKAEWNSINGLNNGYNDTYFTVDYTKDFENGWSAGAKLDVWAAKTGSAVTDTTTVPVTTGTFQTGDAIKWNGKGFVKYTADMYDIAFQTGLDDGIGSAFLYNSSTNKLNDKPAVIVNVKPMEGLTLTADVAEYDGNLANNEHAFDYLVKGVYSLDALTLGGGYGYTNGDGTSATNNDRTEMGVWGSYKVLDFLTLGGEYNSYASTADNAKANTAYQVKATYAADPFTANLSYTAKTENFVYADAVAATDPHVSAADYFKGNAYGKDVNMISADASYKVSDTITAAVAVDKLSEDLTFNNVKNESVTSSLGYKVSVSDTLAEGLVLEGGYQSFIDGKIYVTLTATL